MEARPWWQIHAGLPGEGTSFILSLLGNTRGLLGPKDRDMETAVAAGCLHLLRLPGTLGHQGGILPLQEHSCLGFPRLATNRGQFLQSVAGLPAAA